MAQYIGQRLAQAVFVLWLAATLAFIALQAAPGDPARTLLAASGATPTQIAERRADLGLDDPIGIQYGRYLLGLLRGDLGNSWLHGRAVTRMILEQVPATLELAIAAAAIGTIVGLTLGILAAIRRHTWLDVASTALSVVGLSTPTYWSGILAIFLFALRLRWLPAAGSGDLRHLILPAMVLGFALSGSIARMVRARLLQVLEQPFVLAARARGLPAWRTLIAHALRPVSAPVITVIALQFGFLLNGAVVVESVFARPGLGRLAVEAVLWRDMPVVRGVVLFGAAAYILVNLASDLIQMWLNPRLQGELL